jgi:hypothetical protein
MGSRTVGLFVLPETVEAIDDVAIVASLRDTAARRAAAYAWVEAAEVTSAPQSGARPSLDEDEAALLAAMELPGAVPVDGANADHWLRVTIAVAGYVPWSRVHVVVTSDPLVVASAVVGPKGSAVIDAVIPLDALGAGAHRIRVVGDRDLGGVAVDASGAIVIPADVLDEIQTFDQRTTAIVEVFGEQLAGGNRRLTRYIPIRGDFPWWLLIPGAVANVFVLLARRRRLFATGRRRGGVFGLLGVTAAITSWIAWALFWPELIVGIAALLALGAILVIRSAPSPGRTEVRPAASRV